MFFIRAFFSFLIFAAVLFGSHYFLYFSLTNFFSLTGAFPKNILAGSLAFLAVSFIISSILSHWHENDFTRAYYFLASFWLGIAVNLILSMAVVWIILAIAKFFGLRLDAMLLSSFLIIFALELSAFGLWNALHPQIKSFTVKIPGLPKEWKNKKIVQLSDVHLGQIHRKNFLQSVTEKVNLINPELVVITGDLFDGMDGELSSPVRPLNNLRPRQGILFVTGNHENYLGLEIALAALQKTKIRILDDEVLDINGLKIIGVSYPKRNEQKDVLAVLDSLKNQYYGRPNILLHHSPEKIEVIKNKGINLELCGHTHNGQIFPFGLVAGLLYRGYVYGLHKMGNYTLYVSSGVGTWGPTMRIGSQPEIVAITLK